MQKVIILVRRMHLQHNLRYGRFGFIVEADIKGFFDDLDHEWLLRMLKQRIDDNALLNSLASG